MRGFDRRHRRQGCRYADGATQPAGLHGAARPVDQAASSAARTAGSPRSSSGSTGSRRSMRAWGCPRQIGCSSPSPAGCRRASDRPTAWPVASTASPSPGWAATSSRSCSTTRRSERRDADRRAPRSRAAEPVRRRDQQVFISAAVGIAMSKRLALSEILAAREIASILREGRDHAPPARELFDRRGRDVARRPRSTSAALTRRSSTDLVAVETEAQLAHDRSLAARGAGLLLLRAVDADAATRTPEQPWRAQPARPSSGRAAQGSRAIARFAKARLRAQDSRLGRS